MEGRSGCPGTVRSRPRTPCTAFPGGHFGHITKSGFDVRLESIPSRRHARHEPKGPQIVEYPFAAAAHVADEADQAGRAPRPHASLAPMPDAELILIVEETTNAPGASTPRLRPPALHQPDAAAQRRPRGAIAPAVADHIRASPKILDRQAGIIARSPAVYTLWHGQ